SVVLYRGRELRRFQYYKTADWPGGLYLTPTFAGSRPGALSATCWAALLSMGEDGYMEATQSILEAAATIREGIEEIPELNVIGDPLWVIAFASDDLNIYRVLDEMTKKGWSLNGLHKPQSVHICVTLRHTPEGVVERFVDDLGVSVATTKETPSEKGGMAPVYGMAATIPARTAVTDFLENYVDFLYDV
ncbi:MAG: aspartate aminotransferase family protein, partial [Myxococcota bacterium]